MFLKKTEEEFNALWKHLERQANIGVTVYFIAMTLAICVFWFTGSLSMYATAKVALFGWLVMALVFCCVAFGAYKEEKEWRKKP